MINSFIWALHSKFTYWHHHPFGLDQSHLGLAHRLLKAWCQGTHPVLSWLSCPVDMRVHLTCVEDTMLTSSMLHFMRRRHLWPRWTVDHPVLGRCLHLPLHEHVQALDLVVGRHAVRIGPKPKNNREKHHEIKTFGVYLSNDVEEHREVSVRGCQYTLRLEYKE